MLTVWQKKNNTTYIVYYSQTRLISHWRNSLHYVILSGVDIKRSYFIEVNINIQPFVLLLYITVNINVHMQRHDFQCTSTVHQKVSHHIMLLCLQYYTAKADCGWPGIQSVSTGRSSQSTVEIWEVGRMMWSYSLPPSLQFPAASWQRQWWGRHSMHRGSLTCNKQMAATRHAGMQRDAISWTLNDWQRLCNSWLVTLSWAFNTMVHS